MTECCSSDLCNTQSVPGTWYTIYWLCVVLVCVFYGSQQYLINAKYPQNGCNSHCQRHKSEIIKHLYITDPSKSTPNGRKCYTCIGQLCNQTLSCEGSEDHCISASGRQLLTCACASHVFRSHTHRCFHPLSDFRGTADDHEGLRLQAGLRKHNQWANSRQHWSRCKLLSGQLLQQRWKHQRQPAAPGGTVYTSGHFFIKFKGCLFQLLSTECLVVYLWTKNSQTAFLFESTSQLHIPTRVCLNWTYQKCISIKQN